MDPKKPGEFWKVVNRGKSNNSKGVIQPIEKNMGVWRCQMRKFSQR